MKQAAGKWLRQQMKMLLQNAILPAVYAFWRLIYAGKEPSGVILADGHNTQLPHSMILLREKLLEKGCTVTEFICNFAQMGQVKGALSAMRFMRLYAQAKYVFICDNFLPVSSCRKSPKTTVVQLWHACGLVKKMGYDTHEDIPAGYRGQVYRNYDLMTVSAPCCVEPQRKAMHLPEGIIRALGVSRTDLYFDPAWREKCRRAFYEAYPNAVGKKIILWAPTFRGNAADPRLVGVEAIDRLECELGAQYFLVRKVHPHLVDRYGLSNCPIVTECLLPVADLLITDYSSVVTEFMFFDKPSVLYVPDLAEYERTRGFYVAYRSLSPFVVEEEKHLKETLLRALEHPDIEWIENCRKYHLASCDGHSTQRILDTLGI